MKKLNEKPEGHKKDCRCSPCEDSQYNEYENNYINRFLSRCHSFPRKSIRLLQKEDFKEGRYEKNKGRVLVIESETVQEGYAWIGAAQHNKKNGCKGVDTYNYILIMPNCLTIYFKDWSKHKPKKLTKKEEKYWHGVFGALTKQIDENKDKGKIPALIINSNDANK